MIRDAGTEHCLADEGLNVMVLLPHAVVIRGIVVALVSIVFAGVAAIAPPAPAWAVGSWTTPVDVSATGGSASEPQIVAAPNNTLTAIWRGSNGSNEIIQSSSLGSSSSSSSSSSSNADAGVPGIFLTVAGPVGRSASGSPIYFGADRVSVTSTYLLTVTRVSNIAPTITTLAEGTIDADGSFSSMTRLPALTPGVYNVQMVGTHVNGSTLQLTSQVTIGGVGQFTSIGANIPVIK